MDAAREKKLVGAKRFGREQTRASKEKKHQKNIKVRPVEALAEDWQEAIWARFDKDVRMVQWSKKEQSLARLLMKEVGYDVAVKMVQHFITSWDEPGLPVFSFLWAHRVSVLATIRGQASIQHKQINIDEYDDERDGEQPKIGWG